MPCARLKLHIKHLAPGLLHASWMHMQGWALSENGAHPTASLPSILLGRLAGFQEWLILHGNKSVRQEAVNS